jgi:hypothetical protein
MPKNNGSGRNQRNNPYQLEELFIKFHHTPAGIAWRWRTELLTLGVLAAVLRWLDTWVTLTWAGVILGGLAVVIAAVPHSRRFITRRFWCVLARHRCARSLKMRMTASFMVRMCGREEGPAGGSRRGLGVRGGAVVVSLT